MRTRGWAAGTAALLSVVVAPPAGALTQQDVHDAGPRAVARAEPPTQPTPRAACGPGSRPEPGMQGRVPAGDVSQQGFTCNTTRVGHEGSSGGFKVLRYVDAAGRECAYYDTTLLFAVNALPTILSGFPTGTAVLDMSDPAKPKRTATLTTLAMQSPHESLVLNARRGLLAAVLGTPATNLGIVDIYDISKDCRFPELQASTPLGILGHESGFSPDGKTFFATSVSFNVVTALDLTHPRAPRHVWSAGIDSHGWNMSADGNRAYVAETGRGLLILDTSEIQARKPDPQAKVVSRLTWRDFSISQAALPVTIDGKPYLVEIDEFTAEGGATAKTVGAGRIIDIADERAPQVVSHLRLEVHQRDNRDEIAKDPGNILPVQGYAGHYCGVPEQTDPGIVACSMINSGLRVFDIRDPRNPKEIAYFVAPPKYHLNYPLGFDQPSNFAMSQPSFVPERGEIWYSDGNSGFHAVRLDKDVWPFPSLGLPSAKRCVSRRAFTIRLPRRARSARVTVDGKRVRVRRGNRLTARIDLRGAKKRTVVVRVAARTTSGRRVTQTRRYRTCTKRT